MPKNILNYKTKTGEIPRFCSEISIIKVVIGAGHHMIFQLPYHIR